MQKPNCSGLVILFWLLTSFWLQTEIWSQQNLDSLENLLETEISDSLRMKIYGQVIWPKTRTDPDAAFRLIDEMEELAIKMNDTRQRMTCLYYNGTTYKNLGRFRQSLDYFQKYYDYYADLRDTTLMTNALYQLAVVHRNMGNYNQSLESYNQCIAFDRILNRPSSLATTISARASLMKHLKQWDRAIEDHQEALEIFKSDNNQIGQSSCLLNLGNVLGLKQEYDSAMAYYDSAVAIAEEIDYNYLMGHIYENRGNIYHQMSDFDRALDNYFKALEVWESMGHLESEISCRNRIANLYNTIDNPKNALEHAKQAYDDAEANDMFPRMEESLRIIANSYKQDQAFQQSIATFEEYLVLKDSLFNLKLSEQFAEMDARFETSIKQAEIERLSFDQQLATVKLRQQRIALFISIFSIIMLGYLLRNIYLKSNKINSQKEVIQKSLSEKELLLKEIHHRVKNNLQVISSLLKLQSMKVGDERAQTALDEGRNRVRSMAIIHQNLYQKENLTGINMNEYLQQLGNEIADSYAAKASNVSLEYDVEPIWLDVDTAVPLGLIVNELISNAFKYAFPEKGSGSIFVQLKRNGDSLHMTIADNGIGFNKKAQHSDSGFGLELVESFAERLQAEYELSAVGGTRASFVIKDFKLAA